MKICQNQINQSTLKNNNDDGDSLKIRRRSTNCTLLALLSNIDSTYPSVRHPINHLQTKLEFQRFRQHLQDSFQVVRWANVSTKSGTINRLNGASYSTHKSGRIKMRNIYIFNERFQSYYTCILLVNLKSFIFYSLVQSCLQSKFRKEYR
jgi:hypothetical protein